MKRINRKITYALAAILAVLFFILFSFVGSGAAVVHAATSTTEFEQTDVMDDLKTATINGKSFDVVDYPYDSIGAFKHPEILTVVEYCYSYRPSARENYGLYIYFYNPQSLNFKANSGANKITLGVKYVTDNTGNIKVDGYEKFTLRFCSKSTGDYDNLFYKFKVIDHVSDIDGKTIAARVNSNARRYDISEIELLIDGSNNATGYGVGGTYTFTGYAKGYGADQTAESTLACERSDLETVKLDLAGVSDGIDKRTYWRSNSSSLGAHHQNQINSVFFAIDTNVLEKYGYTLQKIKAEWWEYKTAPALVVQSEKIKNDLLEYAGQYIGESYDSSRGYSVYYYETHSGGWGSASHEDCYYKYCWNVEQTGGGSLQWTHYSDFLGSLSLVFNSNNISVNDYVLTAEILQNYCENYNKSYFNGHLTFNEHDFSADLFSASVDDGRTRGYNLREFDISDPDDLWQINSYDSTHNWFNKLHDYGFGVITTNDDYSDVLPIQMLTSEDFAVSNIADYLKVNSTDVDKLRDYYYSSVADKNNDGKPDNAVFLFRYSQTDYWAVDARVKELSTGNVAFGELRQGTQFFDFDILELTFNKDGDLTTFGCVSSPVDHWTGYTPSIEAVYPDWLKWLKIALGLIVAILLIVLLYPFIIPVLSVVGKVVTAPFKALGKLFKNKKE